MGAREMEKTHQLTYLHVDFDPLDEDKRYLVLPPKDQSHQGRLDGPVMSSHRMDRRGVSAV